MLLMMFMPCYFPVTKAGIAVTFKLMQTTDTSLFSLPLLFLSYPPPPPLLSVDTDPNLLANTPEGLREIKIQGDGIHTHLYRFPAYITHGAKG